MAAEIQSGREISEDLSRESQIAESRAHHSVNKINSRYEVNFVILTTNGQLSRTRSFIE